MQIWKYIYGVLILVLLLILIALFQLPDANLHIIACDVGQGDAILILYKNNQILTDGGPDTTVLNCLGRHLPFWDRKIELIISTHPDADHVTGLVEVVKRYKVDTILINSIDSGTPVYRLLENAVGSKGITVIDPVDDLALGIDLIHLDIESPTEKMLTNLPVKNADSKLRKYEVGNTTNLYSIVYLLRFGKFRGLFLGDVSAEVSDSLADRITLSQSERVNYIKIPHHGSSNGLTQRLLEKIAMKGNLPTYGIISVGKKNPWGLPTDKILTLLREYNLTVLRTDKSGDVEVVTDGDRQWLQNN